MLNIHMIEVKNSYGTIKNYFTVEELNNWAKIFKRNTITYYGDTECWGIDINCLSYAWFKKVVWLKLLPLFDPNMKLIFASYMDCPEPFPIHNDIKPIPNNEKGQHYVSMLIPYSVDNKKNKFEKVSTCFYNKGKELKEQIYWKENSLIWWDSAVNHSSSDFKQENVKSKQYFVIHTYV